MPRYRITVTDQVFYRTSVKVPSSNDIRTSPQAYEAAFAAATLTPLVLGDGWNTAVDINLVYDGRVISENAEGWTVSVVARCVAKRDLEIEAESPIEALYEVDLDSPPWPASRDGWVLDTDSQPHPSEPRLID